MNKKVGFEYSTTALNTFSTLAPPEKTFRFMYLSGFITVRDQNATTFFFGKVRKAGGFLESELVRLGTEKERMEAYIMRPAAVLKKERSLISRAAEMLPWSIRNDVLGIALIDIAVNGGNGKLVWENGELRSKGQALMIGAKS